MESKRLVVAMGVGMLGVMLGATAVVLAVYLSVDDAPRHMKQEVRPDMTRRVIAKRVERELRLVTPAHIADAIWRVWLPMTLREGTGIERATLLVEALEVWQGTAWDREEVRDLVRPHDRIMARVRERLAQDLDLAGTRRQCGQDVCPITTVAMARRAFHRNAARATRRFGRGVFVSGEVERVTMQGDMPVLELVGGEQWRPVQMEIERGDEHQRETVEGMARGRGVALYCSRLVASAGIVGQRCRVITDQITMEAARADLREAYRTIFARHGLRISESALDLLADQVDARLRPHRHR